MDFEFVHFLRITLSLKIIEKFENSQVRALIGRYKKVETRWNVLMIDQSLIIGQF